jgi:hypothetical protein
MTGPTRVAGWGWAADGSTVTWTVAEGSKGRRWREVVALGGATVQALLLETDRDRRFSHLELARADGLWTFHPEPDGTLHGNHVRPGDRAVEHVRGWPFGPDDALLVEGSPVALAALVWARATDVAPGVTASVGAVVIGADGELSRQASLRVERLTARRWRVGDAPPVAVDPDGLPLLDGGSRQPLEQA